MVWLLIGLLLFLGAHSLRIVAPEWRTAQIARHGEARWKGVYSLVSTIGLGLIIWGYGQARGSPVAIWAPPVWARHLAVLLTFPVFVLLAVAYVPASYLRAKVGHPMVAGVKLWAFAHLLANGNLADILLFGSFLAWAVIDFISARRRDAAAGRSFPAPCWPCEATAVAVGVAAWLAFAFWGHAWLIGVSPFGI